MNNAAIYKGVQIFLQVSAFKSLGYIPRSGVVGSDGNSIFNFRGTTIPFFIAAASFYILSNNVVSLHTHQHGIFCVCVYIYVYIYIYTYIYLPS